MTTSPRRRGPGVLELVDGPAHGEALAVGASGSTAAATRRAATCRSARCSADIRRVQDTALWAQILRT